MQRFGLIGSDLSYSFSKIIHEFIAKEMHLDLSYDLIEIEDLSEINFEMYDGFNVTIPFKNSIVDYLTYLDQNAQKLGSVNTVDRNLKGYNTDLDGFLYLVEKLNLDEVNTIVVLGSGAMAQMIKNYYLNKEVIIISRTDKYFNYSNLDKITGDILVNATPISMGSTYNQLIVPEEFIVKFKGVIDLNYNPPINHFLNIAAMNFIPYTNGLDMLIIQAIKAFEILNDLKIDKNMFLKIKNYVLKITLPNIALIGFSYSGKTSYIKEHGGYDLDAEIEKVVGVSCSDLINILGIDEFRKLETNTLVQLVGQNKSPIALGAGAVLNFDNQLILKGYQILDMTEDIEVIRKRYSIDKESRPLIKSEETLIELYDERKKYYSFFKTGDFSDYSDN